MKKLRDLRRRNQNTINQSNVVRRYTYIFVLLFAAIGSLLLLRSFAATGQFILTPSAQTVENGQTFTVQVRLDPGDTIFGVQDVILTFDPNKLAFESVDTDDAYFDNFALNYDTNPELTSNSIEFNQGSFSKTTNQEFLIATVTFRAVAASDTTDLTVLGEASNVDNQTYAPANGAVSITLAAPPTTGSSATFTIESTNPTPAINNEFGLKVYVESDTNIQGGEVKVNLPSGLKYKGSLTNTGSAFQPVTATELDDQGNPCTGDQKVCLVFATQSQSLTGKQLVTTIPVIADAAGSKDVTFSDAVVVDTNDSDLNTTSSPFSITIGSPMDKPTVSLTGGDVLDTTTDTRNLTQSFTITNYDSAADYTITIAGQPLTQSGGQFSLPQTLRNGDHALQVSVTKDAASESSSYTIRLRSFNIDRTGCVGLRDLLAVNKAYGTNNAEYNLDYSTGTPNVGLTDLLLITANWGKACVS